MRVQAVPVSRSGKMATIAVVVEVNGTALGDAQRNRALKIEQGLLTVNATGKASNGTRRILEMSLSPAQWEVLTATALRSVWAIDLTAGRHQLRVASIDLGTGRGGSVYLDIDVPEGSAPGMLVASRFLSLMPTAFSDQRLARWTSAMPTAIRVFPDGDMLTVTVPQTVTTPATARLSNAAGHAVWEGAGTPLEGVAGVQFMVPLQSAGCPVCDLTVQSGDRTVRTTIGIVSLLPR